MNSFFHDINSANLHFIGVFKYESKHIKNDLYSESSYFFNNQDYFYQKYYPNWLHSFFNQKTLPEYGINNNHLQLKKEHPLLRQKQELILRAGEEDKTIHYALSSIEVFLFRANLGIFVIKTTLSNEHHNSEDIALFAKKFRNTTINSNYTNSDYSVSLIEKNIVSQFHSDSKSWRQYNPQLKTAFFLDIANQLKSDKMNQLLFDIGTFTAPLYDDLFIPDSEYYERLIVDNTIALFQNWKVLSLYDSLTRIAVNLDKKDTFRLWENEYILIYVYVLFARYYLYHINNQLTNIELNLNESQLIRNNFHHFMNDFEHSKISYKYLPNEIFEKLKNVLGIKEEIVVVEQKINRINQRVQERYEKRVNAILVLLTILTVLSVAYDAGQMTLEWINAKSQILKIPSFIFLIIISLILVILFFRKKLK
ncbi:hypothetical protein [Aquimarina sp. AU119]|uniref:hypothetical protein n=1 Tax=Aquimarina sp. AU119 TaxID=2108528 RepID=UPI000D69D23F|nr:hypothetical protein [Aquimarina sp. AU119]